MNRKTEPLYIIGLGALLLVAGVYALAMVLVIGAAIVHISIETVLPALFFFIVPGLVIFGLGCLVLKVFIDQLGNAEDQHYSKTVEK